ncbi:MAG: hypothetical protein Q9227_009500 [Pyrenula ochraceoflavens]
MSSNPNSNKTQYLNVATQPQLSQLCMQELRGQGVIFAGQTSSTEDQEWAAQRRLQELKAKLRALEQEITTKSQNGQDEISPDRDQNNVAPQGKAFESDTDEWSFDTAGIGSWQEIEGINLPIEEAKKSKAQVGTEGKLNRLA